MTDGLESFVEAGFDHAEDARHLALDLELVAHSPRAQRDIKPNRVQTRKGKLVAPHHIDRNRLRLDGPRDPSLLGPRDEPKARDAR